MSRRIRGCVPLLAFVLASVLSAAARAAEPPKPAAPPAAPAPAPTAAPAGAALSQAQRKAIDEVLLQAKLKAQPLMVEVGTAAREVRENLLTPTPDPKARQRITKKIADAVAALAGLRIDTTAQILALLTPAQRDLVLEEEKKADWNADLYEILVKTLDIPKL
ncbi:MAG TPA: periplasmic heavy metal sensor [Thermoanaerobaculia bacterium]|nr:periplasmic heavy metal sensor [Thermoanaerobaculia bacterium]